MSNHDESNITVKPEETPASTENAENLAQALEDARKKAAENWDLFLRARADVDNARKRASLEIENAQKYGIEKFAREILAVVDSLNHGLALPESEGKGLREGLELTYKLLLSTLEKFGIHELNPVGESFNPTQHEALSTQVNNELGANRVLVVVQKGFTLHDRLLRPARVIVSRVEGTPSETAKTGGT